MPKNIIVSVCVGLGILLGITQVSSALPAWVSGIYQSFHYGIWSPMKPSQDALPDLLITQNGVVAVSPEMPATATSTDFKKGDIVARRYCLEKSKECVNTFQQSFSNNQPYTVVLSDIVFADQNCTERATDTSKPFFICVNPTTLATMGIDPSSNGTISNWFTLAEGPREAWSKSAKQLWIDSSGIQFNAPSDLSAGNRDDIYDVVYTGPVDDTKVFRSCYRDTFDTDGNKILNDIWTGINDIEKCKENTDTSKVDFILYCNTAKNHCGILKFELRLTAGRLNRYYDYTKCLDIPYTSILRDGKDTVLSLTSITSTDFTSGPATYTPTPCGNIEMDSQIQIRFRMLDYSEIMPAQPESLINFANDMKAKMYIKSLGVMEL